MARDRKHHHHHGSGNSSRRGDCDERGGGDRRDRNQAIDAAKTRMREKLATAVSDLRDPKYTSSSVAPGAPVVDQHRSYNLGLSIGEHRARQEAINAIETEGFTPATFQTDKSRQNKSSSGQTDHEKAMFGAAWQSKVLQKNLNLTMSNDASEIEKEESRDDEITVVPQELAHPRLAPTECREKAWQTLFALRRREVLLSGSNNEF